MIGAIVAKRKMANAYKALNRRDIESFLKDWSDDAVFVYPGQIAPSGEHVGRAAIRAWFENLLAQYPGLRFTVTAVSVSRLFDMTGKNTIIAEWEIEATNHDGYTVHNTGTSSVVLKRAKAVHVTDYIFDTGEVWLRGWGAFTETESSSQTPGP